MRHRIPGTNYTIPHSPYCRCPSCAIVRNASFDFANCHSEHTNDELRAVVRALQAEARARETLHPVTQTFTLTISREPPATMQAGSINTVVEIGCHAMARQDLGKTYKPREKPNANLVIRCIARAQTAPQHGSALREDDINPPRRRPATRTILFADWQVRKLVEAGLLPHSFNQRP